MKELKIGPSLMEKGSYAVSKYLSEIAKIPLLSLEEEAELTKRVKAGEQAALHRLVSTNLRFVVSVAKNYQHRGLSLGDLINEGNCGLIKACEKFDGTKGFKFISFAVWWIRQSIMLAVAEQTRTVRLPLNLVNAITKINKVSAVMEQELERKPTDSELADYLNVQMHKISTQKRAAKKCLSVDRIIDPEIGNTLLDILSADDPLPDSLLHEPSPAAAGKMLRGLTRKETEVLSLYYGLSGDGPLGLDEIAGLFKLSRERIRQLKDTGLKKLRARMLN